MFKAYTALLHFLKDLTLTLFNEQVMLITNSKCITTKFPGVIKHLFFQIFALKHYWGKNVLESVFAYRKLKNQHTGLVATFCPHVSFDAAGHSSLMQSKIQLAFWASDAHC